MQTALTPKNEFEQYLLDNYGVTPDYLIYQKEDNYQVTENINYQLTTFKGQQYMVGLFTKRIVYNRVIKPKEPTKEASITKEIATIAVIMTDTIFAVLYNRTQTGYIATAELVADWAMEFYEKHKTTDWEQVLSDGFPSLCNKASVICWDDAVIDFAQYKLSTYSN